MLEIATRILASRCNQPGNRHYSTIPKTPIYHESGHRVPEVFTEENIATIRRRLNGQPRMALSKPSHAFLRPEDAIKPVRRAAVLVSLVNWAPTTSSAPVTRGRERASIVYNLRSSTLRNHGGQVSFPGGVMDPEDNGDPIRTALRETAEEIGIQESLIQPLGLFHDVTSLNGVIVTPVVAYIPNWQSIAHNHVQLSADEVEEIFEVPLSSLIDKSIYSVDDLKRGFMPRYAVDPNRREKDIWGMTAYISDWLLRSTLADL